MKKEGFPEKMTHNTHIWTVMFWVGEICNPEVWINWKSVNLKNLPDWRDKVFPLHFQICRWSRYLICLLDFSDFFFFFLTFWFCNCGVCTCLTNVLSRFLITWVIQRHTITLFLPLMSWSVCWYGGSRFWGSVCVCHAIHPCCQWRRFHCSCGAFSREECSGADVQEILVSMCRVTRLKGEEKLDNTENHLLESLMFPGCSPAIQCWMRQEEVCLAALSCHFALDVIFLSLEHWSREEEDDRWVWVAFACRLWKVWPLSIRRDGARVWHRRPLSWW